MKIDRATIATSMHLQALHSLPPTSRSNLALEKTISAWEARRKFGQILEQAFYKKDSFVVERSGRPMAVIVSVEDYHKWQRLAKERIFIMLDQAWQRTQTVPREEIEADLEQALQTLRQELGAEPPSQPESP
jgi:prevent-host-death family protein